MIVATIENLGIVQEIKIIMVSGGHSQIEINKSNNELRVRVIDINSIEYDLGTYKDGNAAFTAGLIYIINKLQNADKIDLVINQGTFEYIHEADINEVLINFGVNIKVSKN